MLQNYLKLAWRHFRKNRGYSAINITGLAAGMAVALLIGLWIADELSYDHYHTNHRRIVKVMTSQSAKGEYYAGDWVMVPLGRALETQYRDLFKKVALESSNGSSLLTYGDKKVSVPTIWAEKELTDLFTFRMVKGSNEALKDPSTALISQSMAAALFGKEDPINKTFKLENTTPFTVGGVYEDQPFNSTFQDVAVVLPYENKANQYLNSNTNWSDHNGQLYAELNAGITAEQATARIKSLPTPYTKAWLEEALVYPLDRFHLYGQIEKDGKAGGLIQFVWLFGIIGAFVLLLACINFMNLSTARSEKRAKEVGIRKTVGSLKQQLIAQFLSESLLLSCLAFVVAILLVNLGLPFFNTLTDKHMSLPWGSLLFWVASLAFIFLTGFLAGSYPAFYLARFDPVKVLKGTFRAGRGAKNFVGAASQRSFLVRNLQFLWLPRQVLVVLQFSISLILIIGTLIVFREIEFAKDRPIGYKQDRLLTVDINTEELNKNYEPLRQELLEKGLAENVAASSRKVTNFMSNNALEWKGKRPDQGNIMFRNVNVTPDFGATIGWQVMQGRDFSHGYATDTSAIILNETAVKATGMKDPIGQIVQFGGKDYTIIGVVKNMLTNDPYAPIEPAIFLGGSWVGEITMRLRADRSAQESVAALAPVFAKYNPSSPFLYQFSDEEFARKFEIESRIGRLASVFTGLAIFISCLGLFGLASFVAEQRTKEIGVRKVLGAGIFTLWGLLSKDFLKLIVISSCIAIPLSYLAMNKFLQNYTYRTDMPWWIFALSFAGLLLITLATVSYQSLKAAMMNPGKSLRSE